MAGVKINKLADEDLNVFKDELRDTMLKLTNAALKQQAKMLDIFLGELIKTQREILCSLQTISAGMKNRSGHGINKYD